MIDFAGKNVLTGKNDVYGVQKLIKPFLDMIVQATATAPS
jgi:hypothetical protein